MPQEGRLGNRRLPGQEKNHTPLAANNRYSGH
jgi:hypothetical protein